MQLTYRYRIKDKHAKRLKAQASRQPRLELLQ